MRSVHPALTAALLALAALGAVSVGACAANAAAPVAATDRDLLVRVRLAGLWEHPAGLAAQNRGASSKVREIGAKIAAEHQELDQIVLGVAAELGVELPDGPTAEQQLWLDEMAMASGEEFDRVFVERLRAAHGTVFSLIAEVRAGTRNDAVRALATTANAYVQRHLGYLDSTGLVNYTTLPAPGATSWYGSADTSTLTSDGALGPPDRELLARIRQDALWRQPAASAAAERGTSPTVRAIGARIAAEERELDAVVQAVATQLGVALPDHPDAEQRDWLADIQGRSGEDFDRVFVGRMRAASGNLLVTVAQVRARTSNTLIRALAITANDSVVGHLGYLESSGLVDFDDLPRPSPPPGLRVSGFDRDGGLHPVALWVVLTTAAIAGVAACVRLVRPR